MRRRVTEEEAVSAARENVRGMKVRQRGAACQACAAGGEEA